MEGSARPVFCSPRATRALYVCTSDAQEIVLDHPPAAPAAYATGGAGVAAMGNAHSHGGLRLHAAHFADAASLVDVPSCWMDAHGPADKGCALPYARRAPPAHARRGKPEDKVGAGLLQHTRLLTEGDMLAMCGYASGALEQEALGGAHESSLASASSDEDDDYDYAVMADDIASGALTEAASSCNSLSALPPVIQHPGPAPALSDCGSPMHDIGAQRAPAHAEALERGGLDMAELKAAMTKESSAQEPLVEIIGALLDKTVQRNDALGRVSQLHAFEGERICALSASEYLLRIMRYGKCSPSCAVVGLIYLQRIKAKVPSACVTSRNLQRLLLLALMLANKFLDDLYFSNKQWAKIGSISLEEINALELTVLALLDWKMMVTREEYLEYLDELGCGPPPGTSAADADVWAHELEELKNLVTKGLGIRLHTRAAVSHTAVSTAPHVRAAPHSAAAAQSHDLCAAYASSAYVSAASFGSDLTAAAAYKSAPHVDFREAGLAAR